MAAAIVRPAGLPRSVGALVAAIVVATASGDAAWAEGRVTVRGAYYKEASTRVVQPMVELTKDLPGGVDVAAVYLLDAITSASIAAGVGGVDALFTEYRSEAGLAVGKTFGRSRVGLSYRYSAESDYWSHGIAASFSRRVWGDSGTIGASVGRGFDAVSARGITPGCVPRDSAGQPTGNRCFLDVYFGGVAYTQVLSPTLLLQAGYEAAYLDGFQGNLYRQVGGLGPEMVPGKRLRHAATVRGAAYVPSSSTGFQVQYRYYRDQYPDHRNDALPRDPWGIAGHMAEGRVYQTLGSHVEARLSYRLYFQSAANFWCDVRGPGGASCYGLTPRLYTSDPKLAPVDTHFAELKLTWEARGLRAAPFLRWFQAGAFEISYGRLFQSTAYGNARLLQTGYSLPI